VKYSVILCLFLVAVPCWSQTNTTGGAETKGPCSPAVSGSNNKFTITCGIGKAQGQRMLDILNKILGNQLDPNTVMSKLDEILKAVNPNLPTRAYFCNGTWRTVGPSANAALDINMGGDDSAFQKMIALNNSKQYADLLQACFTQIDSTPGWLTPRLFCGLGYLGIGDKAKAREMLAGFESQKGPAYDSDGCSEMSTFLHRQLDNPTTPN
jgi:hypothetical protein